MSEDSKKNMMSEPAENLVALLDSTDWVIVFDKDGRLKGLVMPEGYPEDTSSTHVPALARQILTLAGIDPEIDAVKPVIH